MRTLIDYDPFLDPSKMFHERGRWPAKWITHPKGDGSSAIVQAFRRTFSTDAAKTVRVHVSADERYELYLDGQRIGRGPERGDRRGWFFETYDLPLSAGQHTLVARSWWLGTFGPSPVAQMTVRPGFVLAAEGIDRGLLNTGFADWQTKIVTGFLQASPGTIGPTGAKAHVVGHDFPWGYESGAGDDWSAPKVIDWAADASQAVDQDDVAVLRPAVLPPMLEETVHVGQARHVQALTEMPKDWLLVHAADHRADEAKQWDALLAGSAPLTVPPRTTRRVIVDLGNYYCAYTDLVTTGGAGATVRSLWAESLFVQPPEGSDPNRDRMKGNRDEIDGKLFIGFGDTFEPDGGRGRLFNTLWWEAGRYVELVVSTADEPLTIDSFSLRQTHYPHDWTGRFLASDPRVADLLPITRRVLEMCSHETYMDCPYFEQMQYVGDTRLEVLTTYTWNTDDRLPRKALRLFDESRGPSGFTQSRWPSRTPQTIPPFSAWWVGMIHDFALWRNDPAFVRGLLPGMRAVLDGFDQYKTGDGLVAGPPGWNYMDWVPGWPWGMPPGGDSGKVSGPLNFQLAWVYKQAAELEEAFGEKELAPLHRRRGQAIADAAVHRFWDEDRGLFADDVGRKTFSEHTQCLALLGDVIAADQRPRVIDHLFTDDRLFRTTIYFTHYLFETCAAAGRMEPLFKRLELWFGLKAQGFKTTLESPEPSRSDCHAWGAHPMYHMLASILGIRPAGFGFQGVVVRPQLGPLQWASGTMPHPKGLIEVSVKQADGKLSGSVKLPAGVSGTVVANGKTITLNSSTAEF